MTARRPNDPSLLSGIVPAADSGGEGAPRIGAKTLDPQRVQQFNAVMQRICPQAPVLIAGQIAAAARRMLFAGDDARERGVASISRRLARIDELEAMHGDASFALDSEAAARIRALITYVEQVDDLIPDHTPVVGQLDDAILVELLLHDLGPQLTDYADYCAWRREIAAREGARGEPATVDCDDWIAARRCEIEATREQRRGNYAAIGIERGFRIG